MVEVDPLPSLIAEAVVHGELSTGTRGDWLARRADPRLVAVLGNTHQARENKPPAWSEEEDRFLVENLMWMTDAEIGAHLGRTAVAVELRWKRELRLTPRSKDEAWPTLQQVAYIMGVSCQKTVAMWINAGLIPARALATARHDIRAIAREALYRWAVNPENWIYFKPERVADPHLRRLIELRAARWDDAWWTPGQVAAYHGVTSTPINRRILEGTLPAKRWGNWWIKRSDAVALTVRGGKGSPIRQVEITAGDSFLLLARAVGLAWETIARMGKWTHAWPAYRFGLLQRAGLVEQVIAQHGLKVHYRAETGDVFADWRAVPGRFPRLEAAHRRFMTRQANARDVRYVAYTLTTWAQWHAQDDEQRYFAYRVYHSMKNAATLMRYWQELRSWGLEPL
jgi:hypothetical protein